MNDSKMLTATIRKQWFDMIDSGKKPEEYREIKPYWVSRLLILPELGCWGEYRDILSALRQPPEHSGCDTVKELMEYYDLKFQDYEILRLMNGYGKDRPVLYRYIKRITVGTGKPLWGAEPGKRYFIIHLGMKI